METALTLEDLPRRLAAEMMIPDDRFERWIFVRAINFAPEHQDSGRAVQAGWAAVQAYRRESHP